MGLNLKEVHKMARDKSGATYVVSTHPYIRLMSAEAQYPLYVQDGKVYTEDGSEVLNSPKWFYTELMKCTPEILESVKVLIQKEVAQQPIAMQPVEVSQPVTVKLNTVAAASGTITK